MRKFEEDAPRGFDSPTDLPEGHDESQAWQDANRAWWEKHPMRYDWRKGVEFEEFSREFYEEIDRRFLLPSQDFLPWKEIPFDPLIDFGALAGKDVLEIGVGNGCHAGLIAPRARSFTGIDLTEYAVKSTSKRMELSGIDATILAMDAEQMEFEDNRFDFIWSWGVIHHSANTRKIIEEMHRVMRPGGTAVTMVYHRSWWWYYVMNGLIRGILLGGLLRERSLHRLTQHNTDGALARYYTVREWKAMVSDLFQIDRMRIMGNKTEVIPLPAGKLKEHVEAALPSAFTRFLTNTCRLGYFLVCTMRKPEAA